MNTALPLKGRHALVTGGSRGIGLAVAEQLAGLGATITLMGRDAAALDEAAGRLAGHGQVGVVRGDIAQRDQVVQAFAQAGKAFGAIDILVNNAGQAESQRFDRIDEEAWQRMIAVNLSGTFHCMQAALPDMLERKWGRIVNVASTAGLIGYAYVGTYCAAKHGVIGLTRALALEVARKGITVNAVCPGYTETDIVHGAIENIMNKTGVSADQARATLAERNPQGRLVQPDEVARAVAWLCLPGAGSINGQAIPVDGGEVMAG
ncbi:MAG: SDR family NAD(P)-dependent oxidoreductase [Burkholderiaceae bacterium]